MLDSMQPVFSVLTCPIVPDLGDRMPRYARHCPHVADKFDEARTNLDDWSSGHKNFLKLIWSLPQEILHQKLEGCGSARSAVRLVPIFKFHTDWNPMFWRRLTFLDIQASSYKTPSSFYGLSIFLLTCRRSRRSGHCRHKKGHALLLDGAMPKKQVQNLLHICIVLHIPPAKNNIKTACDITKKNHISSFQTHICIETFNKNKKHDRCMTTLQQTHPMTRFYLQNWFGFQLKLSHHNKSIHHSHSWRWYDCLQKNIKHKTITIVFKGSTWQNCWIGNQY